MNNNVVKSIAYRGRETENKIRASQMMMMMGNHNVQMAVLNADAGMVVGRPKACLEMIEQKERERRKREQIKVQYLHSLRRSFEVH